MTQVTWRELLGKEGSGVEEERLVEFERLMGVRLPPSYREFLRVTDGWERGGLRALTDVGWLRELDAELVDIWDGGAGPSDEEYFVYGAEQDSINFRPEYLRDMLLIGDGDDGSYLLNPRVVTDQGEWEAWYMAPWMPGAVRYRTFRDFVVAEFFRS